MGVVWVEFVTTSHILATTCINKKTGVKVVGTSYAERGRYMYSVHEVRVFRMLTDRSIYMYRLVVDEWLELKFPSAETGQDMLAAVQTLRSMWSHLLEMKLQASQCEIPITTSTINIEHAMMVKLPTVAEYIKDARTGNFLISDDFVLRFGEASVLLLPIEDFSCFFGSL